jgi:hypothetical protein
LKQKQKQKHQKQKQRKQALEGEKKILDMVPIAVQTEIPLLLPTVVQETKETQVQLHEFVFAWSSKMANIFASARTSSVMQTVLFLMVTECSRNKKNA